MTPPVSLGLRLFRALARAYPHEFRNAYGPEMEQAGEDAIEPVWRSHGAPGLVRILANAAIRLPVEYLSELRQDIRFGVRTLSASKGFTAAAVASLTLGIAVSTAAFSEMNGFLLRDVPAIPEPGRLAAIYGAQSYPHYQRYRERTDLFSGTLAYIAPVPFSVSFGGHSERIWGHLVAPGYFETLGVQPSLGRWFGADEEQPGRAPTVVVSHAFWRQHLDSDGGAVGKTLRVNGHNCSIIGVGPPDFRGASPMIYRADVFLPVSAGAAVAPELAGNPLERYDLAIFHIVARLKPGIAPEMAEAALDTIAQRIEQTQGDFDRNRKRRRVQLLPGGKLLPFPKKDLPFIAGFFAVLGGVILLIASSNVANMVLARATGRRREIAVRLALGASRFRIVRQLLTEAMLVAAAAGVCGFAIASVLMWLASSEKAMPYPMPIALSLQPDGRVFLFTLLLTAFTGLVFGLFPAIRATRADLTVALKEGSGLRLRRYPRLSLRNLLVLVQMAGSLALLLITGFLVIGHQRIAGAETGFDARNLSVISIDPVRDGYTADQAAAFCRKLRDRVARRPAFTGAVLTDSVPMSMVGKPGATMAASQTGGGKSIQWGRKLSVGSEFFDTLGIPIVLGRGFRKEDESEGPMPAIVSEKLARQCWKNEDPLGRRIDIGHTDVPRFDMPNKSLGGGRPVFSSNPQVVQVVGVARDIRDGIGMVATDGPGAIYLPLRASSLAKPGLNGISLLVRTLPGVDAISLVRQDIAAIDDRLTPFGARTMAAQIDDLLAPVRVVLWTYGAIGVFGLVLASVGVAGVTAYSVAQRRREIGIRMALGAGNADVLGLVMKQGALMVLLGSACGLAGAWVGIRALSVALFAIARTAGNSASDPGLLTGAPLMLAAVAVLACYLPARQSLRIDPAASLREE